MDLIILVLFIFVKEYYQISNSLYRLKEEHRKVTSFYKKIIDEKEKAE
jgi:hypothetical protein